MILPLNGCGATVCKKGSTYAIRPLSICLSVCPVCDVGVLWPTVGWIKMKLGMNVGLGLGIVLDGDPAPLPQKGHSPQFSAHVCCGQTAGWMKMPIGMGHIVLNGAQLSPGKRHSSPLYSVHVYYGQTVTHLSYC